MNTKKSTKKTLVLYWADYCDHCKPLVPLFENLQNEKNTFNVSMREKKEICPSEWNEIRSNGILNTFPTIVMEKRTSKGMMRKKYDGDRTKADIVKFAKKRF